uniref:Aldehyde dehydrogenase domain-containing protein n=1 Tax=Buteo japonicus TaxID=224669 RepID=A0A8B9YXN4_9AVES
MSPHAELVSRLRAAWLSGKTRPMEYRLAQLEALGRFLDEKKQDILEATAADMLEVSELSICRSELNHTLNNLGAWMKDKHVEKNWATQLDSAFIRKDPYGVVLIIGPWNYPINLLLVPLIGAIAAGNCVVMKPSEITRNVERLVAETLPRYLDEPGMDLLGGLDHAGLTLLPLPTGSPSVGRIVMTAAAKHLTPVTLELGGKNPCYVSDSCNVQNVARRVAWGRFFNAGQTCVAPDYVLCSVEMQEKLLPEIFGPILPILTVTSVDDAIAFINARERPLVLYVFSSRKEVVKRVLERTSSGGFCANDTIMHMTIPSLPFGGIGMPIPRNWVLREPPQPTEPSTGRVLPAPGGILPRTLPALPSPTAPYPQQVPAALGLVLNPYPVPPGTPQGRAWYRCRPSHPQRLCWGSELGVEPLPR